MAVAQPYRRESVAPGFMTMAAQARLRSRDAEKDRRARSAESDKRLIASLGGTVLGGVLDLGRIGLQKSMELKGAKELQKQKHELEEPARRSTLGMTMVDKGMEIPRSMVRKLPLPEPEILDRVEHVPPELDPLASKKADGDGVSTSYIESARQVLTPAFRQKFLKGGAVSYFDGKTSKRKTFAGGTVEAYNELARKAHGLLANVGSLGAKQVRSKSKGIPMTVVASPYQVAVSKYDDMAKAFLSASRMAVTLGSEKQARNNFFKRLKAAASWFPDPSAEFGRHTPMDIGDVASAISNAAIPAHLDKALAGKGAGVIAEAKDFRQAIVAGEIGEAEVNAIWGRGKYMLLKGGFGDLFGDLKRKDGTPRFTYENYKKWNVTLANLMRRSAQGQLGKIRPLGDPSRTPSEQPSPAFTKVNNILADYKTKVTFQQANKAAAAKLTDKGLGNTMQNLKAAASKEKATSVLNGAMKHASEGQMPQLTSALEELKAADAEQSGIAGLISKVGNDASPGTAASAVLGRFRNLTKSKNITWQNIISALKEAMARDGKDPKDYQNFLKHVQNAIQVASSQGVGDSEIDKFASILTNVGNMSGDIYKKNRILGNALAKV